MRIGIDTREIQNGVITGIGRSLANLINYFIKYDTQHTLILFSEKSLPINSNNKVRQVNLKKCSTFIWDQMKLLKALKKHAIDLFYSPYYKIPLFSDVPSVSQILDLMFLIHPPYKKNLNLGQKIYYTVFGKVFARKSISIITDSQHAKNDIIKQWKVNPQKIIVIPLGLADRYKPVTDKNLLKRVRSKLNLPQNYILYLGNFKPHKNVSSLIQAYKVIETKFPEYKLVLAGTLDKHGIKIKNYAAQQGLKNKVLFTDTVREKDFPEAMISMADLFVFPTLYEGFGLPPLEAMACGTPVVASNLTSIPEVLGDAGILVNPMDIGELAEAISDLLKDSEKRAKYSKNGLKRAKKFREKDTTGKLYEHIISILEEIK